MAQDAGRGAEAWVRTCAGHSGGEGGRDDGAHGREEEEAYAHARRGAAGKDELPQEYRPIH